MDMNINECMGLVFGLQQESNNVLPDSSHSTIKMERKWRKKKVIKNKKQLLANNYSISSANEFLCGPSFFARTNQINIVEYFRQL